MPALAHTQEETTFLYDQAKAHFPGAKRFYLGLQNKEKNYHLWENDAAAIASGANRKLKWEVRPPAKWIWLVLKNLKLA